MNIKLFINKFILLLNKNKKYLFLLTILFLIYHSYLETIIQWYGEKYDIIVDENSSPNPSHLTEYILLTFPTFTAYILITSFIALKMNFLLCMIYPILFCSYIYSSTFCVIITGGAAFWLYIIYFPILMAIFVILCLIGLIKDIKIIKNTKL